MRYFLAVPLFCFVGAAAILIYFSSIQINFSGKDFCLVGRMNSVEVCPGKPGFTRLSQISEHAKTAIMLSEDASFFAHRGFDWFELRASLQENLRSKEYARGGSTITQQLAKNLFLSSEKSILRKVKEAFYTVHLERTFSKVQIFELYLNVIEFGDGIYGIQNASRHYFNKAPIELNVLESSFLAFLLPSPKVYSQSFRRGALTSFARERVANILYRIFRFRRISEEQYVAAKGLIDSFPWRELGGGLLGEKGVQFDSPLPELEESELPAETFTAEEDTADETLDESYEEPIETPTPSSEPELETEPVPEETVPTEEEITE